MKKFDTILKVKVNKDTKLETTFYSVRQLFWYEDYGRSLENTALSLINTSLLNPDYIVSFYIFRFGLIFYCFWCSSFSFYSEQLWIEIQKKKQKTKKSIINKWNGRYGRYGMEDIFFEYVSFIVACVVDIKLSFYGLILL